MPTGEAYVTMFMLVVPSSLTVARLKTGTLSCETWLPAAAGYKVSSHNIAHVYTYVHTVWRPTTKPLCCGDTRLVALYEVQGGLRKTKKTPSCTRHASNNIWVQPSMLHTILSTEANHEYCNVQHVPKS